MPWAGLLPSQEPVALLGPVGVRLCLGWRELSAGGEGALTCSWVGSSCSCRGAQGASGSRLRGAMPYMARLWELGEMGLYAGGTWDSWRCRSCRIILISDDILDSSLRTEQPGVSAEHLHPAAGQGRHWQEVPIHPAAPGCSESFKPALPETHQSYHLSPQSSSAQFYVGPNWDLEWGFEKDKITPEGGKICNG